MRQIFQKHGFIDHKVDLNVKAAPSYLCFCMACMVFMIPRWI